MDIFFDRTLYTGMESKQSFGVLAIPRILKPSSKKYPCNTLQSVYIQERQWYWNNWRLHINSKWFNFGTYFGFIIHGLIRLWWKKKTVLTQETVHPNRWLP